MGPGREREDELETVGCRAGLAGASNDCNNGWDRGRHAGYSTTELKGVWAEPDRLDDALLRAGVHRRREYGKAGSTATDPARRWAGDGSFTSTDPSTFVGSADVTLKPGTPFVLPVAIWYGESYNTGQQPDAPLPESVFTNSHTLVSVDGKSIIDSNVDDLSRWYIGPSYFDPPIVYAEANPVTGAISADFVQGLSFVHSPLSRGTHTLHLESEVIARISDYYGPGADLDIGVKFVNDWEILVTK